MSFPTFKQLQKIKAEPDAGYGSKVEIVYGLEYFGYVDRGYLTRPVHAEGDWDEIGIVHITYVDGDESPDEDNFQTLLGLCKNDFVKYIKIGPRP